MELKMGSKIAELRRKKGMTQEQLAASLGVSAPAVSKWETDSSYPDITLLCPLARVLCTDVDTLLAFEEELSQEKLGQYMAEIVELARQGEISRSEERLNGLLHAYPSCIPLKSNAVGALSFFEMSLQLQAQGGEAREGISQEGISQEDAAQARARWARQKKELAQALHDDGNPAYYLSAVSMLVSMALAEGELDRAEELLKEKLTENLADKGDFTALRVQLYLKKGQRDQAREALQRQAYRLVVDLRACLANMMREELGLERDRVLEVCRVLEEVDRLFSVGGNTGAGLLAEVYLRVGEQEKALEYLEQLAGQAARRMDPPNPLIFAPAIAPDPEKLAWMREMKLAILQGLETDACFEPLRGQERFRALVEKVAGSLFT